MVKRSFDFLASFVALIFLIPAFICIGILVKLDSKGPVFFLQLRVGRDERLFNLIKFRSMKVGSSRKGLLTIGKNDFRVTRFGIFLRKYKLDELPQLINVLLGQMSLVGPRPEVPEYVTHYSAEQRKVFQIRPGITDPASVKFRNENILLENQSNPSEYYIRNIMPVKLSMNLNYLREMNFAMDLGIIFKTIWSIFRGANEQ